MKFAIEKYKEKIEKLSIDIYNITSKIILDDFNKWLKNGPYKENWKSEPGGVLKSNLISFKAEILEVLKKLDDPDLLDLNNTGKTKINLDEIVKNIQKAEKLVKYASIYIEEEIDQKLEIAREERAEKLIHDYDIDTEISNKTWHFFFLNIKEGIVNRAELGRAILETKNGTHVTLVLEGSTRQNTYEGTYEFLDSSNVVFFDLINEENTRHIHFKIQYNSPEDQIMLGIFSRFDQQRLSSSRVVLEFIDDKTKLKEPKYLSYRNFPEELNDIEYSIKDFLSLKKDNFQSVVTDDGSAIDSINLLETLSENQSLFDRQENSFLDFSKPILFLSTPKSSQEKHFKTILEIVDKLTEKYQNNIDIEYKNPEDNLPPFEGLKLLKRTRFFVFILTEEIEKASFSLVQLGWALAHCKHVMIIYRKQVISNRFYALKDEPFIHSLRYDDLNNDKSTIIEGINTLIKKHLKLPHQISRK